MLRFSRVYFAVTYRSGASVQEEQQLLILKRAVEYDYVAIDVSSMVGAALRLSKNAGTEDRRRREVARHVLNNVQQLLKKVVPRKSLLLAMGGPEGASKAAQLRSSTITRRVESRLSRLPGTALMRAVEERLVKAMPMDARMTSSEAMLAGVGVPGCVEAKIASWALDLACREGADSPASCRMCLIGSSDLYLPALALTPYYQVSSLVLRGAEISQLRLADQLRFFGLSEYVETGEPRLIAAARTDILFLQLLCHGCSATGLPALSGLHEVAILNRYHEHVLPKVKATLSTSSPTLANCTLCADTPNGDVMLNIEVLLTLLGGHKSVDGEAPRTQEVSDISALSRNLLAAGATGGYLDHLLDSHAMLCLGVSPPSHYLYSNQCGGTVKFSAAAGVGGRGTDESVGLAAFVKHLHYCLRVCGQSKVSARTIKVAANLVGVGHASSPAKTDISEGNAVLPGALAKRSSLYYPFWRRSQPLTSGEYTLLCHSLAVNVDYLLQDYTKNKALAPELGKNIVTADVVEARQLVGEIFSSSDSQNPHPALCLAPSFHWRQNEKLRSWKLNYVDLGSFGQENSIRCLRNTQRGTLMDLSRGEEGAVLFSPEANSWTTVRSFPLGGGETAPPGTVGVPAQVRLLTWNVMFDRYSGQPTPLGMPGIDWCSVKRYPVLAKLIQAEDADVVAMQEVEVAFAEYLATLPWCRENYIMSCSPQGSVLDPWGVLMLVHRRRLPVQKITHVNIPAWSSHVSLMPVVSLELPLASDADGKHRAVAPACLQVCGVHLLAPYLKSHETARTAQDEVLRQFLTQKLEGDAVAMGDYNDWPSNEFAIPSSTGYVECWPLVHPYDLGKTMDESNRFCKLKIEEIFFGRSDKIFLRSKCLTPVSAKLVGTRSVNEENGNQDAPAYLFPSDHYGVSVTLEVRHPTSA